MMMNNMTPRSQAMPITLTERQEQIVHLIIEGKTNKEISRALFISENTVKYHCKLLFERLNVKSRVDIIINHFSIRNMIN
ncbi:hypothetical protein CS022_09560 [Veronia nyctiphanis]|uniref:HTH luxR-type domain-containing protein n=1 Tax=Veronia nyctiphanis TaxID=1278244 RepID=A0A4Q0YQR0_9GAMM|nr:hypothetical protein CS022_09560 [Veronia nyctiphanis]